MANAETRRVDTGIIQRGRSYRFTVSLGLDGNKKQIRKTTTWTPSENVSQKKADKLAKEEYQKFKQHCLGFADLDENMKFKTLVEEYRSSYMTSKLKPATARVYDSIIRNYLLDYFGGKKLKDIRRPLINKFYKEATQHNNQHEEIPLTYVQAHRIHGVLSSIMSYAKSQSYIVNSPCEKVVLPNKNFDVDERRKFLTEEELTVFMECFKEYSPRNVAIKMLLYTGMRSGELLGLKWSDIDFDSKEIRINRTLSVLKGEYKLTTPKTQGSKRVVDMSETVVSMLKEHRREQHQLMFVIPEELRDMVFLSPSLGYQNQCNLNSYMKTVLKGTGLEFLTLHGLRHSNATLLLNSGVDLKIISEHLGHSTVNTTAKIYTDVMKGTREKTAFIIEQRLAQ